MREISGRALTHVGFDNAAFNIEFFWEPATDAIRLLEINTRIAQHHSDLFEKVHGASNHQAMIDVARTLTRTTEERLEISPAELKIPTEAQPATVTHATAAPHSPTASDTRSSQKRGTQRPETKSKALCG